MFKYLAQTNAEDIRLPGGVSGDLPSDIDGTNGLFNTVINTLLGLVAFIAVIMIIIGGIRYIISNGDQNAVTGAKNTILYAIVGLIIAIFGYAIVNFVLDGVLGNGNGGNTPAGDQGFIQAVAAIF